MAGSAPTAAGGLGGLADQLAAEGLSVEVTSLSGRLTTVGAGVSSTLGRAVTGSGRVWPGSLVALRPLVLSQVAQGARRQRSLLPALAALAVLAARRRRRSP